MTALAGLLSLAITRGAVWRDPEADAALDGAARGLAGLDHANAARVIEDATAAARAGLHGVDADLVSMRAATVWACMIAARRAG